MKNPETRQNRIQRKNLSDQVTGWLMNAIQGGLLKPGDRLPSVESLATELEVGRSSVREALRTLQAKGIIEIYHGKGCFIAAPRFHLGSVLKSFSENIRQREKLPGSVILKKEVILPAEPIRSHLKLVAGEKVNFLQRLRLADQEPLAVEISCTPLRLFPDLLSLPWEVDTSLYQVLRERYQLIPAYANQAITAILLSESQSTAAPDSHGQQGGAVETLIRVAAFLSVTAVALASPESCTGWAGVPPADADGDGYAAPLDCQDRDPAVHPGAADSCNGLDDDCDGTLDPGCSCAAPGLAAGPQVLGATYGVPLHSAWGGGADYLALPFVNASPVWRVDRYGRATCEPPVLNWLLAEDIAFAGDGLGVVAVAEPGKR